MAEQEKASDEVNNLLGLGPLEAETMTILWDRGHGTVADVAAVINEQRTVAYTTVMTIMSRLATKGLLIRELTGKAYIYRPAMTLEQHQAGFARGKVRALVRDFGDLALTNFVEEIESADPERLRRLAEFLERRGAE